LNTGNDLIDNRQSPQKQMRIAANDYANHTPNAESFPVFASLFYSLSRALQLFSEIPNAKVVRLPNILQQI
jgi:hypothetical protein